MVIRLQTKHVFILGGLVVILGINKCLAPTPQEEITSPAYAHPVTQALRHDPHATKIKKDTLHLPKLPKREKKSDYIPTYTDRKLQTICHNPYQKDAQQNALLKRPYAIAYTTQEITIQQGQEIELRLQASWQDPEENLFLKDTIFMGKIESAHDRLQIRISAMQPPNSPDTQECAHLYVYGTDHLAGLALANQFPSPHTSRFIRFMQWILSFTPYWVQSLAHILFTASTFIGRTLPTHTKVYLKRG